VTLVQPGTLLRRHRDLVRRRWTSPTSYPGMGRFPQINPERDASDGEQRSDQQGKTPVV
jgi:hypothetical protein